MTTRGAAILGLLAGVVLLTGGCGGATDVCAVSGEVTFDGQPVKMGMVAFEPAEGGAPGRSVRIVDGRYEVTSESGIKPGKYLARITAPDVARSQQHLNAGPNDPVPPAVPLLPPAWNTMSRLTVELVAGDNTANFSGTKTQPPTVETGGE